MTQQEDRGLISEHLLEVRYKANAHVLDLRGEWAAAISAEMELPHWGIIENRIDIFSKGNTERAFAGHKNCGYIVFNPPTPNFFPDRAGRFLSFLLQRDGFQCPLHVLRLGVRSKFITPYGPGFDDLRDRFASRYIGLKEQARELLDATLIDIGAPLNFADALGNFNTYAGPMQKKQMTDFIERNVDFPEVGLYFDIDYWRRPQAAMNEREIIGLMKSFASTAWERNQKLSELICRG